MKRLLLALLLLLAPTPALATIAFDAASEATHLLSPDASDLLSWTHTPVGTPKGVFVACIAHGADTTSFGNVTYGGVTADKVFGWQRASATDFSTEMYFLGAGIPTGAQTVTCDRLGTATSAGYAITVTAATDTRLAGINQCGGNATDNDPTCTLDTIIGASYAFAAIGDAQSSEASTVAFSGWTLGPSFDAGSTTSATAYRTAELASGQYAPAQPFDTTSATDRAWGVVAIEETEANNLEWEGKGGIITEGDNNSSTTTSYDFLNTGIYAGDVVVCAFGSDDTGSGTTDGANNQLRYVFDNNANTNTWVYGGDYCNMQTSTAADGACAEIWYSRITTTISETGNFNGVWNNATIRDSASCMVFDTNMTGYYLTETAGQSGEPQDAADPGALTVATAASNLHLFVRATAQEGNGAFTQDADYLTGPDGGNRSDSGTDATSIQVNMGYRIASEADAASNDLSNAEALDNSSVMIGLDAESALPATATFSDGNGRFLTSSDATGTTPVTFVTVAQTLAVGDLGICTISFGETGTGTVDGDQSQITSITDESGNTWVEVAERCNMQTSTALNGSCTASYYSKITTQLDLGDDLIVTMAANNPLAIVCQSVTPIFSGGIAVAAGGNAAYVDGVEPGSMTVATGVSAEYIFVRSDGCEWNTGSYPDQQYFQVWSENDSGSSSTSQTATQSIRIFSEATSDANDPLMASGQTPDCASYMYAITTATEDAGWAVNIIND